MTRTTATHEAPDFSLVLGGPLFQFFVRARLCGTAMELLRRRMLFFVAIVSSFFVSQGGGHLDPRTHDYVSTWHPISVPSILWLNTALLLISSLTMEMGRRQLFRETSFAHRRSGRELGRARID